MDLTKQLKKLSKCKEKLMAFRAANEAVLDSLHKLETEANEATDEIRALVKGAGADLAAGSHTIAEGFGTSVVVQRRMKIDGEALVALHPKVLKLANKITIGIPGEEARRLLAAGVIKQKSLDLCTRLETAILIKDGGETE